MNIYRIHGDNIVECERIAGLIIDTLPNNVSVCSKLISPSTVSIEITSEYSGIPIHWRIDLLPGFNKNTKKRWEANIFDSLKDAGSFLDETPDAIVSKIVAKKEKILLGIEFCSALQAGNQAWQRSARAFSTGRTGCPYLYIVDFVKYELDNTTRNRKSLRFPNAAVPYSYVNYSKITGNFIAQLYTKSEEFDRSKDSSIVDFNEDDFGNEVIGPYIVKLMLGVSTAEEEKQILDKNMDVVEFLADHFDYKSNFTSNEWREIFLLKNKDIIDFSVEISRFGFHKTIAEKSQHGMSSQVVKLVDQFGVGLASKDLPFGIIPAEKRVIFAEKISKLYPNSPYTTINKLKNSKKHLIVAIFKGFKPRGDDNRPDRGVLPFVAMLSSPEVDILSFIYGPILERNLNLLDSDPEKLANKNGLWKSILSLSNFVLLDVPVIANAAYDAERLYDTSLIKNDYKNKGIKKNLSEKDAFSCVPINFGEDDVDTGIHYLFTYVLGKDCFEGMCNPPGGDWSGFSVIDKSNEYRWLSLPRVSDVVNGKRPDHILELFGVFDKPLLLSIESKERSSDLEVDVGTKLITYIKKLMEFVPSAKRQIGLISSNWKWGDSKIDINNFETMSAAAYLKKYSEPASSVFKKNCEILFVMTPVTSVNNHGWDIEIIPSTTRSQTLKNFIVEKYNSSGDKQFNLH